MLYQPNSSYTLPSNINNINFTLLFYSEKEVGEIKLN